MSDIRQLPWFQAAVEAQQAGFVEADMHQLVIDPAVYVHTVGDVPILFRSGAVVIPSTARDLIQSLLLRAHSRTTCHAGPEVLRQSMSHVYWVGMRREVDAYAASCVSCQLGKAPRTLPASAIRLRMAMQPFAELQMDTLVFPARITEESGYVGIFVVSDDFTGWVWLTPVRDQKAATFAGVLLERVLRDFPIPRVMRSDNHPSFVGDEMRALFKEYGIEHRLSAPYNAREHGGAERAVGITFERLRVCYAGDVPAATAATERGFRDGASPAHLGYSPREISFNTRGEAPERAVDLRGGVDLASALEHRAAVIDAVQRWMLRQRIDRQYRREQQTGPSRWFSIGESVMLLRPPKDKMTQGAVAPYTVVAADESGAFYSVALMGPDGEPVGLATRAAAGQLRPFDMTRTTAAAEWDRLVAQEFGDDAWGTVEVSAHRASEREGAHSDDLEFLVLWATGQSTWEPALELRDNVDFQDYVRRAGIPPSRVRQQVARERRRAANT
jgi:transposase InsO family protein